MATRKLDIEPLKARQIVKTFEKFEIVPISAVLVYEAINLHILEQLHFWDSLIVAAASSANCVEIISEDFNPGQTISGIKITNPFPVN